MNKPKELKDFQTWHVEEPYENFVGPFYFKSGVKSSSSPGTLYS